MSSKKFSFAAAFSGEPVPAKVTTNQPKSLFINSLGFFYFIFL